MRLQFLEVFPGISVYRYILEFQTGQSKSLRFGTRCQRSIVMSRKGSHLERTNDVMGDAMANAIRKIQENHQDELEGIGRSHFIQ